MPADVRSQACAYLRAGKVTVVVAARCDREGQRPELVRARVEGNSSTYFVRLNDGVWLCSCEEDGCPHAAAVQLVTGHDGLARKPGEAG